MFTSSFAWTPSPASVASTSFAFMFDEVPEPVWKTSIGNWSSSSPAAIRAAPRAIRSALSRSSRPRSAFARAAAPLMRPSQRATGARDRLPGDREVGDRLRRLAAPELLVGLHACHASNIVRGRLPAAPRDDSASERASARRRRARDRSSGLSRSAC